MRASAIDPAAAVMTASSPCGHAITKLNMLNTLVGHGAMTAYLVLAFLDVGVHRYSVGNIRCS